MAAWISGNGALASLAADRTHTLPGAADYTLLGLLDATIRNAVPPNVWDQMRRELL